MTNDNNNKDNTNKSDLPPTHLSPSNVKLGGWKLLKDPAAAFSHWGKIRAGKSKQNETELQNGGVQIDMKLGNLANDNPQSDQWKKTVFVVKTACAACAILILGTFIGTNYSTMMTKAIMNADSQTLDTVMQTNPEALAFDFNAMDIGE